MRSKWDYPCGKQQATSQRAQPQEPQSLPPAPLSCYWGTNREQSGQLAKNLRPGQVLGEAVMWKKFRRGEITFGVTCGSSAACGSCGHRRSSVYGALVMAVWDTWQWDPPALGPPPESLTCRDKAVSWRPPGHKDPCPLPLGWLCLGLALLSTEELKPIA